MAGSANSRIQYRFLTVECSSRCAMPPTTSPACDLPEWQAAIEVLMLVVELGGPTMFARIGIMRGLNRGHVREFNETGKKHHWGKRKLKRDE